jgi:hypothetical protein
MNYETASGTRLETASFAGRLELRSAGTDRGGWFVEGIVVPYGETTMMAGDAKGERFVPGSCTRSVEQRGARLKLVRAHDHRFAVGTPVSLDPKDARGLFARFRGARTPAGEEVRVELEEGVLDSFSVGFRTVKERRGPDGAREILEADIFEVSLLPLGAYAGARVTRFGAAAAAAPVVEQRRSAEHERITAWLRDHPVPEIDRNTVWMKGPGGRLIRV